MNALNIKIKKVPPQTWSFPPLRQVLRQKSTMKEKTPLHGQKLNKTNSYLQTPNYMTHSLSIPKIKRFHLNLSNLSQKKPPEEGRGGEVNKEGGSMKKRAARQRRRVARQRGRAARLTERAARQLRRAARPTRRGGSP